LKEKYTGLGVFLIIIGIAWVLYSFGLINWNIIHSLRVLWPLILVVAGINLIFQKRPVIKGLSWILFLVILVVHSFYTQDKLTNYSGGQNFSIERSSETESCELRIDLGGLKLNIASGSNNLVDVESNIPDFNYTSTGKQNAKIHIKKDTYLFNQRTNYGMDINLNNNLVWDFVLNTGATKGNFDFSDIQTSSMKINIGAAKLDLKFGSLLNNVDVEINAGASSFNIYVPENTALKIDLDGALNDNNFSSIGLIKNDGYYYSPDYEKAVNKINMEIDMGVGNIKIIKY